MVWVELGVSVFLALGGFTAGVVIASTWARRRRR